MNNKACCWVLAILGVFLVIGMGMFLLLIVMISKATAPRELAIRSDSYLLIDLSDVVSDHTTIPGFAAFRGGTQPSVSDIFSALHYAKTDDRIKGIIVRPSGARGFGGIREVREALRDFRSSEKPVYAYLEIATDRDYYLASVADTIVMYPGHSGGTAFLGIGLSSTYLARTFDKIGIKFHVLHIGDYKGAFENFGRESMSEELRSSLELVVNDLFNTYTSEILSDRPKLTREKLDHDLLSGERLLLYGDEAVERGYGDLAMSWAELEDRLSGEDELELVKVSKYARSVARKDAAKRKEIAVLFAQGGIEYQSSSPVFLPDEEVIYADALSESIAKLAKDDDVAAVVLRVNSPGGSALASELITQELLRLKEKKPVVASMGGIAASGGYYISCEADKIIAQPNTITGSIGVVGMIPSAQELYKKIGARVEVVEKGKWANFPRFDRDLSAEEEAILVRLMRDTYDEFVAHVSRGRNMTTDEVHAVGEGRLWTGDQAKANKLVDEIGGIDAALEAAAELAEIDVSDARIRFYPKEEDIVSYVLRKLELASIRLEAAFSLTPNEKMVEYVLHYLREFTARRDYIQTLAPVQYEF